LRPHGCDHRLAVLTAVKAWAGNDGARGHAAATPSLDGVCARRPRRAAGRDEETVLRSNKETNRKGRKCRAGSGITLIPAGASTASDPARPLNPKRTTDVLPKPDNFKSYRQNFFPTVLFLLLSWRFVLLALLSEFFDGDVRQRFLCAFSTFDTPVNACNIRLRPG
jgi:hypothetical protein